MSDFQTTNWSLIAAAASAGITVETYAALDQLCKVYWTPVLVFVQRSWRDPESARDLAQSFFTRILEHHNTLATVDPGKGRFRAWLLGALQHFLANERRRERALKRGGGIDSLSLDEINDDDCCARAPADPFTPERVYDRQWALAVLERALDGLRREYVEKDRYQRFEQLLGFLMGDSPAYDAVAGRLGVKPKTLRVEVHRLRRRFRNLLRAEIKATVQRPADVDDELRHLLAALTDAPQAPEGHPQ